MKNRAPGEPAGPQPEPGRGALLVSEPLIRGRDTPLQSLLSVLLGLDDEANPGALLIGDSGIGKSSLLRLLDGSVPGVLHGRACTGDRLAPYSTLTRWLGGWVAGSAACRAAAASQLLSGLLPERCPPGLEAASPGPPDVTAFHSLMLRAAPGVTAWTLDDLHLADDASAEWLLRLVQQSPPTALPWVISSQPPEAGTMAEAVLEAMAGLGGVRSVLLGPLARADVFEWVMDSAGHSMSAMRADAAVQALLKVTQGLPLHLALLMQEAPQLGLLDGDAANTVSALPSVTALLGARLAQLPPTTLAVARAAAIAGQAFHDEPARDYSGLKPQEYAQALQALEAQGLWQGNEFIHEQVREAVRQAMPEGVARTLHAHWATWLESAAGQPARIAAHWQAAGQDLRALPGLRHAAAQAQRLNCMPERIACLVRAAQIAEAHSLLDEAFDCSCEAFEAHTESIRHTQGQTLLQQMQRLARSPRQRARAATQATWHAMVHGDLDAAVAHGEQAVHIAQAEADAALLAPAQQHLGTALGVQGQLGRALPLLLAAEPWVKAQLPNDEQASFLSNLAAVLDNLGRSGEARQHHLRALSLTARHLDGTHRATLLANYATSRLEAGDPLGARELAQKAQTLVVVQDAHSSTAGFIAALMAPCERTLGRYTEALDWCDRAEHILSARNAARMPVAQLQRAHVWMDLGQHERALELLSGPGLPLGRQLPARHAVRWLLLLARAQARQGLDASPTFAEAQERLPTEGWPELALLLRAEQALLRPGTQAAAELRVVAAEAAQRGLDAVALSAWLPCALLAATGARDLPLAEQAADAALALMVKGIETPHVDRALRWLAPAHALLATGEAQRARGLILRGQQWLRETAQNDVPPWARDSFLNLNPLNLLLQDAPLPAG